MACFTDHLNSRKYRVVMDGLPSERSGIMRGAPQGSILGPLPFTINVNDFAGAVEQCTDSVYNTLQK